MKIIIKNGKVVTNNQAIVQNIKIENGVITAVGSITPQEGDRVVDAEGRIVLPGGVDVHTHLDLDAGATMTADDFYSGTRAALAGGTTTVVDFATQSKGKSLKSAMEEWSKKAEKAYCDYGFHLAIIDWNDAISEEMQDIMDAGITSFKMYMAYKDILQVDDGIIYKALKRSTQLGGLIGFHCENGDLVATRAEELIAEGNTSPYYHPISRPDTLEEEAIFRLCKIAELADAPIWVVHLSTSKGLDIIKYHKKEGLKIVTETCPQYLLLDDSNYGAPNDESFNGAKYVISPPLRKKQDITAMWQGLKDESIDFVSTDHCSFNLKGQKEIGKNDFTKIPNGGPGLEHRMILLYNYGVVENRFSLSDFTRITAQAPAEMFGLTNKGSIEVGKDADLIILDPNGQTVISAENQLQNVDYTPYEGLKLSGKIDRVLLRGQEVFADGEIKAENPVGKFQKRTKGKF